MIDNTAHNSNHLGATSKIKHCKKQTKQQYLVTLFAHQLWQILRLMQQINQNK
jgi:hypothetical protein